MKEEQLEVSYTFLNDDGKYIDMHATGYFHSFKQRIANNTVSSYIILYNGEYTLKYNKDKNGHDSIIKSESFGDDFKIDLSSKPVIRSKQTSSLKQVQP